MEQQRITVCHKVQCYSRRAFHEKVGSTKANTDPVHQTIENGVFSNDSHCNCTPLRDCSDSPCVQARRGSVRMRAGEYGWRERLERGARVSGIDTE